LISCSAHNTLIVCDSRKSYGSGLLLGHQGTSKTINYKCSAMVSASTSPTRYFTMTFFLSNPRINTTTNPQAILGPAKYPTYKSLGGCPCYTPLLIDIRVRCWKAIEVIAVASSELVTTLALCCRMLRMRRGPNTNICTVKKNWRPPV
jgi:hypothetical protein